ncbi:MAG: rhomboid family intramembrane serine protease [Bacteroidales bacterium]|nr:rhomboid family intramembrane serine protease [Bacteroidales bacterium]MBN2820468.1 rhomboid family intramembrane serine protease [Bacteroidales bacterium]
MYRSGNILDEIRDSFRRGSTLTKLIYVNLGVFLVLKILYVIFFLFSSGQFSLVQKSAIFQAKYLVYLMVPSNLNELLIKPWTPLTYMFLHFGFLHILFNLIILFWFGRIFLHYLNEKQLLTTYLLGGLAGAAMFILAYNIFPGLSDGVALGASASVMAVVISISFYNPNYEVLIPFIGSTKLKYIALFYVVLDVLQIASDNSGGHLAHLGGALYGYLFAVQLKRGKDTGKGFSKFIDGLVTLLKPKPKLKVTYKNQAKSMTDFDYNKEKAATQKEVDKILDKIAQSGYDSLTKKEKEILFKLGGKS